MVEEARKLSKWADNIIVKIPMIEAGLKAINTLSKEGIKTNCTLIFSLSQGIMAMKAGANSTRERGEGFEEATNGKINLLASQTANFDRAKGMTVMENLLQAHPDVKAVFC